MPQWRKLHVKILESLDVAEMPDDFTRLTWVLLPLILDRKGRAEDEPRLLRNKLYPRRDDVSAEQVAGALAWFAERGMLERYSVAGRRYFQVPTFAAYQGKTDRETASSIPDPDSCQPSANLREAPNDALQGSQSDSSTEERRGDSEAEVDSEAEEMQSGAGAPPPLAPAAPLPLAVQVYVEKGGKFPAGKLADGRSKKSHAIAVIAEKVRETPESLALWGRVVEAYQLQWSAKSYTVMINDYYLRGRVPGAAAPGPPGANPGQAVLIEHMRKRGLNGNRA